MPLMIKLNRKVVRVYLCLDNGHFITVYDKKTGVLTINGRNKKCVVYANHPRNASHYKINFTVD